MPGSSQPIHHTQWRVWGGGRGNLSYYSATLINVIWSWQCTPNSSRPWSSCLSLCLCQIHLITGTLCRKLSTVSLVARWGTLLQCVRGQRSDCLTWHLRTVCFIIVCIYHNEGAGYFVRAVMWAAAGNVPIGPFFIYFFIPQRTTHSLSLRLAVMTADGAIHLWSRAGTVGILAAETERAGGYGTSHPLVSLADTHTSTHTSLALSAAQCQNAASAKDITLNCGRKCSVMPDWLLAVSVPVLELACVSYRPINSQEN